MTEPAFADDGMEDLYRNAAAERRWTWWCDEPESDSKPTYDQMVEDVAYDSGLPEDQVRLVMRRWSDDMVQELVDQHRTRSVLPPPASNVVQFPASAPTFDPDPVAREVARLRMLDEARETYAAEKAARLAATAPKPDVATVADLLARPAEPPHRVDGLIPWLAFVLIVALRKTGKTTFVLNLIHALLTGVDFLGKFRVVKLADDEAVALLNYEVSGATIARWSADVGIGPARLVVANLRGVANPLATPQGRADLAATLRAHRVKVIIVDPFRMAFTGDDQNSAGQVTRFLAELDTWARSDVGATDVVLVTHSGWEGERSRGSSSLEDHPDSIIYLRRGKPDGPDPEGRYFSAQGRDVDADEDRLIFDPTTKRLTLSGQGSRTRVAGNAAAQRLVPQVVAHVQTDPGCSQRTIEAALGGNASQVRKAVALAASRGLIDVKTGPKGAHQHFPKP